MVREEQFSFRSASGDAKIHGVQWIPEGEICAVLQITHGMAEHIERYRSFAVYLAEQGILVTGHDHLGHGLSAKQEDYGYFAKKNGNRALVRDIHTVYRRTRKQYPDVPYVLLGHSMGSFLARQYLCCYGSGLDGAILCGTGYHPEAEVRLALSLCRAEAAVKGWRYRSHVLNWMVSGSYNLRFAPNRTEFDWICRDDAVVDAYLADDKCGFAFTLNGYYNMFLALYKIVRPEYLTRMKRTLPVLFIAGEEDPVGGCGKGVRKVVSLFKKTGMEQVECKLYSHDRHEVLNELDRYAVYGDILDWMQRHGLRG